MIPKQSIRHIQVDRLIPHPGNVRDEVGDVAELASSIREHGILQPLVVTEHPTEFDRWLLLAGHRRAKAACLAGLTAVPCVIRHNLDDDPAEQLVVMLVENCQRRDLGPVEKAQAYGALRNRGLTVTEIARRTGITAGTVSYYLNLLLLDEESLEQVRTGETLSTAAIAQVRERRQADRAKNGAAARGRPVVIEPPHFTATHPLADTVKALCSHTTRSKVGRVGCGQCWETAIRDDAERTQTVSAAS